MQVDVRQKRGYDTSLRRTPPLGAYPHSVRFLYARLQPVPNEFQHAAVGYAHLQCRHEFVVRYRVEVGRARRELEEETGLKVNELQQIGAYTAVDRDPRGRTVSVAYLAVMYAAVEVEGGDDAARAEWFPLSELPGLAFDHAEIIRDGLSLL